MTHATRSSPRIGLEATLENINNHEHFLTSQTQSEIIFAVNNAHSQGEDIQGGPCLEPCLALEVRFLHLPGLGGKIYFPPSS